MQGFAKCGFKCEAQRPVSDSPRWLLSRWLCTFALPMVEGLQTRPTGQIGNRTQEVIGGAATNFVYNNVNQMTSRSGAQGAATYTYDLNGSLTSDGVRTFEWDAAS